MNIAYIGLGSNLGESQHMLQLALADMAAHTAIQKLECSRFYRSSPVDSSGPDYVNAVARLETSLTSLQLLHWLQEIENRYGRERPYVNAPRTLDLDILLFNNEINQSTELTLPHPRMHQRAFVLLPLQELSPGLVLAQGTLGALLEHCKDQGIELL
ncbi:MAG: 2-amino-4-hydroxy-6-hydroxymethyldihydropteridine diphosphokinase [Advenella sp.]|nr:2-amino-4-hydroxy-6-hydroxymethyldihydropteridine diphosphokinase [Advenella sp.]